MEILTAVFGTSGCGSSQALGGNQRFEIVENALKRGGRDLSAPLSPGAETPAMGAPDMQKSPLVLRASGNTVGLQSKQQQVFDNEKIEKLKNQYFECLQGLLARAVDCFGGKGVWSPHGDLLLTLTT